MFNHLYFQYFLVIFNYTTLLNIINMIYIGIYYINIFI